MEPIKGTIVGAVFGVKPKAPEMEKDIDDGFDYIIVKCERGHQIGKFEVVVTEAGGRDE